MKTFRTLTAASFAFLAACASSKEVSRSDARVSGPQVQDDGQATPSQGQASSSSSSTGDKAKGNDALARSRMPEINPRAKLLFEDANRSFETQRKARRYDYPALSRKYQAALDADPKLAEAAYNMGVLSERAGSKEQAIAHYKDALRRKPTLKEASENLAVLAQNAGDTQTAAGIYQDILRVYPDDASSRARLAQLYFQAGDTDKALEFAREALIRDPKTLPAYKVMMKAYLEKKQLALAKLVALRAVKLDEGDPELYATVGQILMQEGDAAKARLQFKKAVEVRPDYLPARVVLAKLALQDGDYQGAEEHLRKILAADGKNAEAHLNLGIAYRGLGQIDKALAEYDQAEKLNPELAGIYLARGVALHKGKNAPERGLELYRKYMDMTGGGAGGDAPVLKLIHEAEQSLSRAQEEKLAQEEAKRMEQEAKAQEKLQKQMEAEQKAAAGKSGMTDGKGKDSVVAAGNKEVPKPPEAKKKAPAPTPDRNTVPAKGTTQKAPDEPSGEEPSDEL